MLIPVDILLGLLAQRCRIQSRAEMGIFGKGLLIVCFIFLFFFVLLCFLLFYNLTRLKLKEK